MRCQTGLVETNTTATDDNLLRSGRHDRILGMLRAQGQVQASALAETFGVSSYTIRRDLDELAEAGLLERVHGGAVLSSPVPRSYRERQQQSISEKDESAQAATMLLEPNQIVIVDGGSTALRFVAHIPANYPATFITNTPAIAAALVEREPAEVISIGGRVDRFSHAAVGPATVDAFRNVTADLCVLGIWGITASDGISTPHYEEAMVRSVMVNAADKVVGLAVGEKLGTAGGFTVAPATALTHLAVERGVDQDLLRPFRELGVSILQLDGEHPASSTDVNPGPRRRASRTA
ncbi:MAG: DeoR/GlpR family DNA-binding transcription regulator [Microbacterium sp.]